MKCLFTHIAACLAVAGVGSIMAAGCTTEDPDKGGNVTERDDSADSDALTMNGDSWVAHATRESPSLVRVAIYDRLGAPQFSVGFALGGADEETIRWTSYEEGAEAAAGSLRQEMRALPALDDSIRAALYMQTKVSAAIHGEQYDNYGCDIPTWVVDSCGSKGKCCDVHDACYAEHGCTASSWYWTWPGGACDKCNGAVVKCILTSNPGPSECCAAGNCGEPR